MKITIEIENDSDIHKLISILNGENINIVSKEVNSKNILEQIYNEYNISLPEDYKFNREELYDR